MTLNQSIPYLLPRCHGLLREDIRFPRGSMGTRAINGGRNPYCSPSQRSRFFCRHHCRYRHCISPPEPDLHHPRHKPDDRRSTGYPLCWYHSDKRQHYPINLSDHNAPVPVLHAPCHTGQASPGYQTYHFCRHAHKQNSQILFVPVSSCIHTLSYKLSNIQAISLLMPISEGLLLGIQ